MAQMAHRAMGFGGRLRLPEMKVALISLAHCVNDMYAAFLPTFIPFIRHKLGLSYAMAGSFNVVVGIFHIFCQPAIGYLCDRIRRPYLMMFGPVLCGLGAVMIPNMNSYAAAVVFAGLWGLGSALYHPQGGGGIGYVSDRERLNRSLTLYNIAGTIGTAISPLIAVATVKYLGYPWLPITLVPAVLLAPVVYYSMPYLRDEPEQREKGKGFVKTICSLFALLYPMWAIAVIRDTIYQCVRFFLPMKIASQGGSLENIGMVIFLLSLVGSFAMVPMEWSTRRFGGRRSLLGSLLAGSACLMAAVYAADALSMAFYIAGSSFILANLSLLAMTAQNMAPGERSAAATIVTGLAWGVSNMMVSPFGKLADMFGIEAAFIVLALMPLLALPLFLTRPLKMMDEVTAQ